MHAGYQGASPMFRLLPQSGDRQPARDDFRLQIDKASLDFEGSTWARNVPKVGRSHSRYPVVKSEPHSTLCDSQISYPI